MPDGPMRRPIPKRSEMMMISFGRMQPSKGADVLSMHIGHQLSPIKFHQYRFNDTAIKPNKYTNKVTFAYINPS